MVLDLVAQHAPRLRAAGVLELDITGLFSFKLAPAEVVEPALVVGKSDRADDDIDHPDTNPWNDPATFGRSKGVPGKDPRKEPGQ